VLEITLKSWTDKRTEEWYRYQMAIRLDELDRIDEIIRMRQTEGTEDNLRRFPEAVERKAYRILKDIAKRPKDVKVAPAQPFDVELIAAIADVARLAREGKSEARRVGSLIVCGSGREKKVNLLAPTSHQFMILCSRDHWTNEGSYDTDSLELRWTGRYQFCADEYRKKTILTRWYSTDSREYLFGRDPKGMIRKLARLEKQILKDGLA
jgi:hypothetical protein